MEYVDIVDDNDTVIGQATKKEIYEKFHTHRIVHVLIFNKNGELGLQLRSATVRFCPRHWVTSVGGHVQAGESYEQAAMREAQEELGIAPKLVFAYKDIYNDPSGIKKLLTTFRAMHEGPFQINPEEVERIEFFSIQKIKQMISSGEKFHPELLLLLRQHFGV